MIYDKKLKLPANPFKNWETFYKIDLFNFINRQWTDKIHLYPTDYLTDETMDVLSTHRIKPLYIVMFKDRFDDLNNLPDRVTSRLIHRDIQQDPVSMSWDKIHCGINWEMFNSSQFSWWDMSQLNEVYPDDNDPQGSGGYRNYVVNGQVIKFNGVHYSNSNIRGQVIGTHAGEVKLCETYHEPLTPYLVRTDVPHMVLYNATSRLRYSISIRVDETDVNSWEDALELFRPLYNEE
jgi:hypothetical protein